jgi:hypothetical protein
MPQKVNIGTSDDNKQTPSSKAVSSSQSSGVKRSVNPKVAIGTISGVIILAALLIAWTQGMFSRSSVPAGVSTADTVSTPFSDDNSMGNKRNPTIDHDGGNQTRDAHSNGNIDADSTERASRGGH